MAPATFAPRCLTGYGRGVLGIDKKPFAIVCHEKIFKKRLDLFAICNFGLAWDD